MRESQAPLRLKANHALVTFGFGTCRAWIVICLASSTILSEASDANWLYLAMGAITAALVALSAEKGLADRLRKHLSQPAFVLACVSALAIPASLFLQSALLAFAGFMAGGVSAGLLQILWGERFVAHDTRGALLCSAGAAIVTAILTALMPSAMVVGYIVFPLASFGLLALERHTPKTLSQKETEQADKQTEERGLLENKEFDPSDQGCIIASNELDELSSVKADNESKPTPAQLKTVWKFMATVAIFSLLTRMFDMLPTYGSDPLGPFGGSSLFSLIVVGIIFMITALVPKIKFNSALVYRIAVPIMALGFIATVMLFGKNSFASLLLIGIGYELFDIVAWVLFADLARRQPQKTLFIFGTGVAAMFTGMAAGILMGSVIRSSIHGDATQTTTLALACILALVVVGFLVLPESLMTQLSTRKQVKRIFRVTSAENAVGRAGQQEPNIEEACATVATQYGLTPRESEVLVFLAKGRTISIVARDLQIAKGTARTHAERIYRKLDVHKQQELIDLVGKELTSASSQQESTPKSN